MTIPVRERLFAVAWRAALLLLPWQARFIFVTPFLNGFQWEQSTVAVFVSWVPLLATIALAWGDLKARAARASLRAMVAIPLFLLLVASLLTSSFLATLMWWVHVLLLVLFASALLLHRVSARSLMAWFVFSLIPHAVLGMWQFAAQHVRGSTFLGIAEQISWKSGVSVVEYGEYRVLRAYGGFPHPNIFGGWLAVALVLLPEFIRRAKTVATKFAWIGCGAFFLSVLVLTFSRGAWIAAAVGFSCAIAGSFRRADVKQREALFSALFLFVAALAMVVFTQWDAVSTRFRATERLERWSIVQRVDAIHDGFVAFKQHPLFGWGPGASLVGVAVARTAAAPMPLEPPHLVPFVVLLEGGVLGLAAVLVLMWFLFRPLLQEKRWMVAFPFLSVLTILALTDHYLWTLWAGNALFAVVSVWVFSRTGET